MSNTAERFTFALAPKTLISAVVATGLAFAFLWVIWITLGMHVATASYLAMMLLLTPARISHPGVRVLAAGWAVVVAVSGYLVGTHGLWATVVGIAAVSIIQSFLRFGDMPAVTRSPVNFVVFAGLALTDTRLDQVALGSVIGAVFILGATALLPMNQRTPGAIIPVRTRLTDGLVLASGAVLTVVLLTWLDFHYVNWALLSFCMIVAVGAGSRTTRVRERVLGTLMGVVAGTLISLLPMPAPLILSVIFVLLCVAYQLDGNYTMFVAFVTPSVLVLSSADASTLSRGVGRIEAVLASAAIALLYTWVARRLFTKRNNLSREVLSGELLEEPDDPVGRPRSSPQAPG